MVRALLPSMLAALLVAPGATTIEPRAQDLADGVLRATLKRTLPAPAGGALVVLDLRDGSVVAMASRPEAGRAGLALPPGSVVKPFIALALAEAGAGTTPTPCPARLQLAGAPLRNHVAEDLPAMRLDEAIAHSCNTVFYRLASDVWRAGRFEVPATLRAFGFGRPTGVVPDEDVGVVPDPSTERAALSLAIGQASLLITPLQLAIAYAALLRGPIAHRALDGSELRPVGREMEPAIAATIRAGARGAIVYGTATAVFEGSPLEVAGKTGTAIFGPRPASWFAGWAPADAPRYLVVAAFENAGFGSDVAAPAVRRVLHGLFGVATSNERFLDGRLLVIIVIAVGGVVIRGARWARRRGAGRGAGPRDHAHEH